MYLQYSAGEAVWGLGHASTLAYLAALAQQAFEVLPSACIPCMQPSCQQSSRGCGGAVGSKARAHVRASSVWCRAQVAVVHGGSPSCIAPLGLACPPILLSGGNGRPRHLPYL